MSGAAQGSDRIDVFAYLDFRAFLRDYYVHHKSESSLSHRSFARAAGVRSPNYLKLVIDGARNLSDDMARRFAKVVCHASDERQYFFELVRFNQAKSSIDRGEAYAKLSSFRRYQLARPLEAAHARYHEHWYFPAIRELAASPAFREDPEWIAQHLLPRITRKEAEQALELLIALGLLRRNQRGELRQGEALVSTGAETASVHVPNYHRSMMARASEAIDLVPPADRDISALTLCLGSDGLERAKERVRAFRRELLELSELEADPRQVVQLNIQLFPLSDVCED